jgi:hypothetical protein
MMSVESEMAVIAKRNGGLLRPVDVVEFAEDKRTELHGKFTWDDSDAAVQYRLWQAREIIRVSVSILPHNEKEYRTYVSLMNDRTEEGGGYRSVVTVLANRSLRESMLEEALNELGLFRRKYAAIKELAGVFDAIDDVSKPKPRKDAKRKVSRQREALAVA